jgi:hypothetical protein
LKKNGGIKAGEMNASFISLSIITGLKGHTLMISMSTSMAFPLMELHQAAMFLALYTFLVLLPVNID